MANEVKIIQQCQVSPPQGSIPSPTTIPFSHLDILWFQCNHVKRIFYYNFPHSTQHFLQTSLPILKDSLSQTLQHFFPFSSKSIFPPKPQTPYILYSQGDSISLTICESKSNFNYLISNSPKDLTLSYPFAPLIPPPNILEDGTLMFPTMAIQITIFPNFGFTICLTFRHEIADGKAFHHFIKYWSSLSKGNLEKSSLSLPLHNKKIIQDPENKKQSFLEQLWNSPPKIIEPTSTHDYVASKKNMVRHRFNLTRHQIECLKKWVVTKSETIGLDILHLSTFVVTCSLLWICKIKLKLQDDKSNDSVPNEVTNNYSFGLLMDMRTRFNLSIPSTYFGNCLITCIATLPKEKLMGENGICEVANAIGKEINLRDPLHEIEDIGKKLQNMTLVIGSPKFDVYKTDFGWGNPILSEVISADESNGFGFSDSKDEDCVEVVMVLEKAQVKKFNDILEVQLRDIMVPK